MHDLILAKYHPLPEATFPSRLSTVWNNMQAILMEGACPTRKPFNRLRPVPKRLLYLFHPVSRANFHPPHQLIARLGVDMGSPGSSTTHKPLGLGLT